MPSVAKSVHWFVRVDGPQEFLKEKCLLLGVHCTKMISVFHQGKKGENPHCHFLCSTKDELQKQSWDVKLKKLFGVSGNGYSSKPWDGELVKEGAGTYLFHESLDSPILSNLNVSAEEIEQIKATAQLVNKVIAANREKAETKIPGKVILKWFDLGFPSWIEKDIVEVICTMARDGECYLPKSDFQWKAYVEEIKLKMCTTPAQFDSFVRSTYLRLYSY